MKKDNSFTMADRRSCHVHTLAFTMAEILISLTIIGVIASITLPALRANINESMWRTQRKALYSRMSQAISMLPSLNGYGIGANDSETAAHATETFITDGLSKVLKITNVCDSENFKKCGFPDKITKMGKKALKINSPKTIYELYPFVTNPTFAIYSQINTKNAAFETLNGESILVSYNPNCSYTYGINGKDNVQNLIQPTVCANFIYDINGNKGPNRVGKDIGFMTAFYPTGSAVAMPYPSGHITIINTDSGAPDKFTIGYGNQRCRKKYGNNARMANLEELISIFVNNKLGYTNSTNNIFLALDKYISSTLSSSSASIYLQAYYGAVIEEVSNSSYRQIFCVK